MAARAESGQFTVGEWTVTPSLDRLERNGEAETIEPTAMAVLTYLARHANQVVSAEEFTTAVWNDRIVGDDAVYQRIHRLRSVFHDDPHNARYIETIPTKGYRLIAAVEFPDERNAGLTPDKRRLAIASTLLIAAILFGASYLLTRQPDNSGSRPALMTQEAGANSIAVLPFVDLSDEQDQKYLGDGISEELIHTLSNVKGLRVAARTSAFRVAETGADIRTMGQRLNVARVLEGSVRKEGDQIRITAQLVSADDGYHLWSKTYDRNAADLYQIQREITAAVVESFGAPLMIDTAYSANQAAITDVDFYGYYLLGRHHLRAGSTPDLDQAVTYFRRAIELNPDFSRAYSGLASAHLLRPQWLDRNEDQVLAIAKSAIEQALTIDSQDAQAHAALGMLRERHGDNAGAIAAFEEAIKLQPNNAMPYLQYSWILAAEGRKEDTLAALQTAARLEPFSGRIQSELGDYYRWERDLPTAMEYWQKAIELEPKSLHSYGGIVDYYYWSGQLVQCALVINQYIEAARDETLWGIYLDLMWIYRSIYDLDTADFWLDRLLNSDAPKALIPHERVLALLSRHEFEKVDTILHSWVSDVLDEPRQLRQIAWYEMIIGHDVHAQRTYERVAELVADGQEDVGINFDISFGGYHPDINRAHLMIRNNQITAASELLATSRVYIVDYLKITHYPAGKLIALAAIDAIEGNRTEALNGLRKAIDAGWTRVWWTELDPNFESLRDDPEYQQIIAEAKTRLEAMREEVHRKIGADPSRLFSSMN